VVCCEEVKSVLPEDGCVLIGEVRGGGRRRSTGNACTCILVPQARMEVGLWRKSGRATITHAPSPMIACEQCPSSPSTTFACSHDNVKQCSATMVLPTHPSVWKRGRGNIWLAGRGSRQARPGLGLSALGTGSYSTGGKKTLGPCPRLLLSTGSSRIPEYSLLSVACRIAVLVLRCE